MSVPMRSVANLFVRHLDAYGTLIAWDLKRLLSATQRQVLGWAVLSVALGFLMWIGCIAVIACTWDTPNRLPALMALAIPFAVLAAGAILLLRRSYSPLLSQTAAEWRKDRAVIEMLLAQDTGPSP